MYICYCLSTSPPSVLPGLPRAAPPRSRAVEVPPAPSAYLWGGQLPPFPASPGGLGAGPALPPHPTPTRHSRWAAHEPLPAPAARGAGGPPPHPSYPAPPKSLSAHTFWPPRGSGRCACRERPTPGYCVQVIGGCGCHGNGSGYYGNESRLLW